MLPSQVANRNQSMIRFYLIEPTVAPVGSGYGFSARAAARGSRLCTLGGNTSGAATALDWFTQVRRLPPHSEPGGESEKSHQRRRRSYLAVFFTPKLYMRWEVYLEYRAGCRKKESRPALDPARALLENLADDGAA